MSFQGLRRGAGACLLAVLLCLPVLSPALAYEPDPAASRAEVPEDSRWKPEHIFDSREDWEAELAAVQAGIPELTEFQGRLGESAEILLDATNATYAMLDRIYRLYVYAQTLYDVDQAVDEHRRMQGRVQKVFPSFGEATAWMEPELLEIDPAVIRNFMAEDPDLAVYEYYFEELWRQQEHTLSSAEERLMALTGNMRSTPNEAHEALLGVDMTFPEIVGGDGEPVAVTVSGFPSLRAHENYVVRKQAADAFFGTLRAYENTFGVLLDGAVKSHIMTRDARGYESCLEASLSPDNISTGAYRMLIDTVRGNLPRTLHAYVELRRKVLGLEEKLTFPNLYNPLLEGVETAYTYDEGRELIVEALQPLGDDYVALLAEGMDPDSGWIDVYPNKGKRSGAYSNGVLAAKVHPFVLHNFDNTLDAVSTTAHEMGHALHSVYASRNQPPVYARYTTFLAEIASTCNEALLTNHMLRETDDTDMQLLLLNQRLESIRLTIFRQTLFADFELRFHEYAEQGNPLTAAYLNELYGELIREYYGPGFELGPDDECEWMFIPHFYYDFYVFTYATGLVSGIALADMIDEHGEEAAQRYIDNMLKAGSSAPPLQILRDAGVDLETPAPIEAAMDMFAETVAEFDRVWSGKYGRD